MTFYTSLRATLYLLLGVMLERILDVVSYTSSHLGFSCAPANGNVHVHKQPGEMVLHLTIYFIFLLSSLISTFSTVSWFLFLACCDV